MNVTIEEVAHGTYTVAQGAEISLRSGVAKVAGGFPRKGLYQVVLDLSDMINTDALSFKVYDKVNGAAQAVIHTTAFTDNQSVDTWTSPMFALIDSWDITVASTANSIIVVGTIRRVVFD